MEVDKTYKWGAIESMIKTIEGDLWSYHQDKEATKEFEMILRNILSGGHPMMCTRFIDTMFGVEMRKRGKEAYPEIIERSMKEIWPEPNQVCRMMRAVYYKNVHESQTWYFTLQRLVLWLLNDVLDAAQAKQAADAVVFKRINGCLCILLVNRKWKPLGYALPGGHVNYGEKFVDAAKRELKEETMTDAIGEPVFLGLYDDPARDPRGHVISAVFIVVIADDARPVGNDDAESAVWLPVSVVLDPNFSSMMAFDHQKIIADAVKKMEEQDEKDALKKKCAALEASIAEIKKEYEHRLHVMQLYLDDELKK